jgi:hypothetical protein
VAETTRFKLLSVAIFLCNKYSYIFRIQYYRAKDDINMYNNNLSFGRKCFATKACYLWKTLPDYLKINMSVKCFKRKCGAILYQLNNYILGISVSHHLFIL